MKVTFTTPFARLTAEVDDREAGYIMQELINSAVGYEANKKQSPEPTRGGWLQPLLWLLRSLLRMTKVSIWIIGRYRRNPRQNLW